MAITVVGTVQVGGTTNGTDVTLTFSTAPSLDDYTVLIGGHFFRAGSPLGPVTAGYTAAYSENTANPSFGIWYKKQGASPDTTVVGEGTGNTADANAYLAIVLRGVDKTTPLDVAAVAAALSNPPAITPITNDAFILVGTGTQSTDNTPGTVSGYTSSGVAGAVDTNRMYAAIAYKTLAIAATEDPPEWSGWISAVAARSVVVAFRPDTSLQEVIDSWQTSWNVRADVTDSWQTSWNVNAEVVDAWQTSWQVRITWDSIASSTWSSHSTETWDTIAPGLTNVTDSWQTSWNVQATVSDSWQTSWNVLSSISDAWQTSWNVRASISDAWQTSWNVRASITDAWQTSWNVRANITDAWQTSWNVRTSITDAWQTSWNVRTSVTDAWQTSWNIVATVTDAWQTSWNIIAEVTDSWQTLWGIGGSVETSWATYWDILALFRYDRIPDISTVYLKEVAGSDIWTKANTGSTAYVRVGSPVGTYDEVDKPTTIWSKE